MSVHQRDKWWQTEVLTTQTAVCFIKGRKGIPNCYHNLLEPSRAVNTQPVLATSRPTSLDLRVPTLRLSASLQKNAATPLPPTRQPGAWNASSLTYTWAAGESCGGASPDQPSGNSTFFRVWGLDRTWSSNSGPCDITVAGGKAGLDSHLSWLCRLREGDGRSW